jgi:hypothetical protein
MTAQNYNITMADDGDVILRHESAALTVSVSEWYPDEEGRNTAVQSISADFVGSRSVLQPSMNG